MRLCPPFFSFFSSRTLATTLLALAAGSPTAYGQEQNPANATPANDAASQASTALTILTEAFPPFSYLDDSGKLNGQSTAIVQALQQELGLEIPITLTTWDQAYQQASTQANVLLYSTARTPEREELFAWVGPIASYQHAFYSRADKLHLVQSLEDARRIGRVGTVRDTARHDFLRSQGFDSLFLYDDDVAAYTALAEGEVNLVLGSSDTVALAAAQAGLGPFSIAEAYPVREVPLYLAFSPGTPAGLSQRWQEALDQLKTSGRYQAILAEWGHRLTLTPGIHTHQVLVDGDTVTQLLATLIDSQIDAYLATLTAVANTPVGQSADWQQIQPILKELDDNNGSARFWFAYPDGRYYTALDGLVNATLDDRPYFSTLLGGERVEGEPVLSRSTGRQAAIVAAPILRDRTVVGALGASVFLADMAEDLSRNVALPTDTWLFAIDSNGTIALHPEPSWIGQPATALAPELAPLSDRPSGIVEFQAEGRHWRAVWNTAPLSGWRAVVAKAVGGGLGTLASIEE